MITQHKHMHTCMCWSAIKLNIKYDHVLLFGCLHRVFLNLAMRGFGAAPCGLSNGADHWDHE